MAQAIRAPSLSLITDSWLSDISVGIISVEPYSSGSVVKDISLIVFGCSQLHSHPAHLKIFDTIWAQELLSQPVMLGPGESVALLVDACWRQMRVLGKHRWQQPNKQFYTSPPSWAYCAIAVNWGDYARTRPRPCSWLAREWSPSATDHRQIDNLASGPCISRKGCYQIIIWLEAFWRQIHYQPCRWSIWVSFCSSLDYKIPGNVQPLGRGGLEGGGEEISYIMDSTFL